MTWRNLGAQVWLDLAPTTGRARDATRVTVAALLVCLVMFATSMPFIDLGVYLVFLLAQRDTMLTRLLAVGSIFVAGMATFLLFGVMAVAWDVAWLRLLLWTAIFFVGYFLMRVFVEPDLFLGPLAIIALCTFIADQFPLPNLFLDQVGWLWALLLVVVSAFLLTDWLFDAPTPRKMLRKQTLRIFELVASGMRRRACAQATVPLDMDEVDDAIKRASLLVQTKMLSSEQASRIAALLRRIARVENYATEVGWEARPPSFWIHLADCIDAAAMRIQTGRASLALETWPTANSSDALAQSIKELRESVDGLESGIISGEDYRLHSAPIFLPDWKTNSAYISFALRATAATMGTYLFMSLTAWNGIHTCMITCVVTALSSIGAQVQKQNLRMAGATVGAIAGVGALIFILPSHQSLLGLLVVLAVTSFCAAWVATGPLRIGYAGLQIALAVYYVLLADPHISTEIAPIRDRLIGIFIGILAMRIAFVWLAPSSRNMPAKEQVRS